MRPAGAPGLPALWAQPAGRALVRAGIMLAGLTLAMALRLDVAGSQGTGHIGAGYRPIVAGLVFALVLLGIAWAGWIPWGGDTVGVSSADPTTLAIHRRGWNSGTRGSAQETPTVSWFGAWAGTAATGLAWGVFGAAVLIAFPLGFRLSGTIAGTGFPVGDFPLWASVVTLVAVAEEMILRGALFAAVDEALGTLAAVLVTAVAFALLHVPLYGPGVLPLDCAVGVWLGTLRVASRSITAPATAHTLADLAVWWLV